MGVKSLGLMSAATSSMIVTWSRPDFVKQSRGHFEPFPRLPSCQR